MTDAAGNPTPEQPIVEPPPPEAAQLPTEGTTPEQPDQGFGDRFDQIKAEIRAEVDQKLAEAAEVARQAINDLSDKVDALQARWDERGTS